MDTNPDLVEQHSVLTVLRSSLSTHHEDLSVENEVRYKLLIEPSEDDSLIRLLFAYEVLNRDSTKILVCSNKFPGDSEAQKVIKTL